MIFVFAEDQTLAILDNINDVRRECEGIDVENNVYQFFDEKGLKLEPKFIEPNKKGKISGLIGWVQSGVFNLEKSNTHNSLAILDVLKNTLGLKPNKYFQSLGEIREFLINL